MRNPTISKVIVIINLVLALSLMFGALPIWEVGAENPHKTVYYRINGGLDETEGVTEIVGGWRHHAMLKVDRGLDDGEKEFTWRDREWSFDAEFVMCIPGVGSEHYRLRNTRFFSWGGQASWVGRGHGKQDAVAYEFRIEGQIDIFVNGTLLAMGVGIEATFTRECGEEYGKITIFLDHELFRKVVGGMLKGKVYRFQAIDFWAPTD